MNTTCLVCDSPTKSHHVATTDGVEQYCCHSCWQRRNDPEVQEALAAHDVLPGEVLDELLEEYRDLTTAVNMETSLPDLPSDQTVEIRQGAGGDVFELAGAKQVGKSVNFDGQFAGVVPVVDLPREPLAPVYAAFGYTKTGAEHEEAYLAWIAIGGEGDDLAAALDRVDDVLRGEAHV